MAEPLQALINEWTAIRDLSMAEAREKFNGSDADIKSGRSYEKLTGLQKFAISAQPGTLYYKDGLFILLYVPGQSRGLDGISPDDLKTALGEPDAVLRSRSGKVSRMHVYPQKGIAYSAGLDRIEFVEVFQPAALEWYLENIYQDPGAFTK
jgi:hypothetical protein